MTVPGPGSRIEVDADALHQNLKELRRELGDTPMVMVVKADAYGHGIDPIVPLAMDAGQTEFAVFSAHEAWHVQQAAPQADVQIMGHIGRNWDHVATHRMQPWLGDIAEWPAALNAARKAHADHGHALRVHLEVETGMHRTGLIPENAMEVLQAAAHEEAVEVVGLCTHLAGAEDQANQDRIEQQIQVFENLEQRIRDEGLAMPVRHIASSSAALVEPAWRKDLVRVGVASYGMWPTPEVKQRYLARARDPIRLRRLMTWRSTIMALQDVPAGHCVGYGMSACVTQDTHVATIPVGYSDGLSRSLSNAGHVLIHGQRCPIIGPVSMNMPQVDVTHLQDPQPGDDVVLIGTQGEAEIAVHSFVETQEVVNYEFMARLDEDIPRVVVRPALAPGN